MHIDKQFRRKFDPKAVKMILVGYQGDSTNYRLYNPRTKKVSVSRDVTFNEKTFGEVPKEEEATREGYSLPIEHGAPEEDEEDIQAICNDEALPDVHNEAVQVVRAMQKLLFRTELSKYNLLKDHVSAIGVSFEHR